MAVATIFLLFFPPISTNFRPERPIFRPRKAFFSVCLRGRHVCPADISARQTCLRSTENLCPTEMSRPERDVSARQRCLCPTEMSVRERDTKKTICPLGPKNRRVVIKAHPEKWDNYSDTTLNDLYTDDLYTQDLYVVIRGCWGFFRVSHQFYIGFISAVTLVLIPLQSPDKPLIYP